MKVLFLFGILFFSANAAFSQTHFARLSGDWDQTNRWSTIATGGASCGCVPGPGDDVLIDGYDIDVDANTGNVTVADLKITNDRGVDVRLRVQGGVTLTITNDFEIESTDPGNDSELFVEDASLMDVDGNFLADQDAGDDLNIEVDDAGTLNIDGNADFLQDGGDDMFLRINDNSGSTGTITIDGNLTWDHDGGDDGFIYVDDASSDLNVGGFLSVSLNSGDNDDFLFNLDNGTVDIAGDLILNRTSDCNQIDVDMESCILTCDDLVITSSGPEYTDGAVRFFIDGDSQVNCASWNSNFSGADDLYIRINVSNGTTGQFNCTGDMTVTRTSGDDTHFYLDEDGSQMNIGGDFLLNHSGLLTEEWEWRLLNDASVDITGNCTMNITDGEDVAANDHFISLAGAGANPTFHVGGNFSWTSSINLITSEIDIDGGTFDVDGNMTVTQNAGANIFQIYIDGTATADVGGTFDVTMNGGVEMEFSLGQTGASTSTWTVGSNASLVHNSNSAGSTFIHEIYHDTQFIVGGDLNLTTNFAAAPLFVQDMTQSGEVNVTGNVNLSAPGGGDLEIEMNNTSVYRIGGNFVRAAAPNRFGSLDGAAGTGLVVYQGTGAAQLFAEDAGDGGDSFYYHNVEINNTFGTSPQLTMEGLATINNDITFTDGVILSDATNILVIEDNATATGASDASHVEGYHRKIGNDAFTFPSGHDGFYAPLGITAPGTTTDFFECRYFNDMPHDAGFDSTAHDPTISWISKVEYWQLNRTAGASTPTVTLSWDTPRSGGVGDPTLLKFAAWDGSNWDDMGITGITGTPVTGTLDNNVAITTYDGKPFTLATTDIINPLPVELLTFTGEMKIDHVDLRWITASEEGNAYFDVERSKDGENWEYVAKREGAGTTSIKQYYDAQDYDPYIGISYYRLKQVDTDGDYKYSNVVAVSKDIEVSIYPNPTSGDVYVASELAANDIQVFNAVGQRVQISFVQENELWKMSTMELPNGTYFVHFMTDAGLAVERLIVQH